MDRLAQEHGATTPSNHNSYAIVNPLAQHSTLLQLSTKSFSHHGSVYQKHVDTHTYTQTR